MGLSPQKNMSGVIVGRRNIENGGLVGTNKNNTYILVGEGQNQKRYTADQILSNPLLTNENPGLKEAAMSIKTGTAKIEAASVDYLGSYYDDKGVLHHATWRKGFGGQPKERITLSGNIQGNLNISKVEKIDGVDVQSYTPSNYSAVTVTDAISEGGRVLLDQSVRGNAPGKTTSKESYSFESSSSE